MKNYMTKYGKLGDLAVEYWAYGLHNCMVTCGPFRTREEAEASRTEYTPTLHGPVYKTTAVELKAYEILEKFEEMEKSK